MKMDPDLVDKIIRDQLIYKENQLKIVLKKYIEICSPSEQLNEEKLQTQKQEFYKELNLYEFQIAKAVRQMEAQKFDGQQNQDLKSSICISQQLNNKVQRSQVSQQEIERLKQVYNIEEAIKKNKQSYEDLSKQIVTFDEAQEIDKKISTIDLQINSFEDKNSESLKKIKLKEKQIQFMMHIMKDLLE